MPDVTVQPGPRPTVTATVAVSPVTAQVTVTPGPRPQAAFSVAVTRPAVTVGIVETGGAGLPAQTAHKHVQSTPAATWTIPNPWGTEPASVTVKDATGRTVLAAVEESSAVQVVIVFPAPRTGSAYLVRGLS